MTDQPLDPDKIMAAHEGHQAGERGCVRRGLYPPDCLPYRLAAEVDRLRREGSPGVMHEVDKAFYDLTVKERDYERRKVDRLAAEVKALREQVQDAERAAILRFLDEQSVRYRKHSAVALVEDYTLASEMFGFDVFAALTGEGTADQPKADQGCPACSALPDEMCVTGTGEVRNDHAARRRGEGTAEHDNECSSGAGFIDPYCTVCMPGEGTADHRRSCTCDLPGCKATADDGTPLGEGTADQPEAGDQP